jgi:hypothetical protein
MLQRFTKISLALCLISCDVPLPGEGERAVAPPPAHASLSDKAALYQSELAGYRDADGFLAVERCDSLLWTGLHSASIGGGLNLQAAETEPGKWLRRPPQYGKCARSLSRDSLRGVLVHSVFNNDPDQLSELWRYYHSSGGFADSGLDSIITPQFAGLIARALIFLEAPCDSLCQLEALVPNPWTSGFLGFEAHLQALDALVEVRISGGSVPDGAVHRVSEAWVRNPINPFLAALHHRLTGAQESASLAEGSLMDASRWPEGRLPNGDTICDDWPTQREYGPDWNPCPNEWVAGESPDYRTAGAAWLFSYFVLTTDKINGDTGGFVDGQLRSATSQINYGIKRVRGLGAEGRERGRAGAEEGVEDWKGRIVAPSR